MDGALSRQASQLWLGLQSRYALQQAWNMLALAGLYVAEQVVKRQRNMPAMLQITLHAKQQVGGHFRIGQCAVGFVGRGEAQKPDDAPQ